MIGFTGAKLHEEFSQKLQNTELQTQADTPVAANRRVSARTAAADATTSILAPDTQMSTRSR